MSVVELCLHGDPKLRGGSRLASILAVQGVSNAVHGAQNDAERVFRHGLYRIFRIERELLRADKGRDHQWSDVCSCGATMGFLLFLPSDVVYSLP